MDSKLQFANGIARPLKELLNEINFLRLCLIVVTTNTYMLSHIVVTTNTNAGTATSKYCEVNFTSYTACTKHFADKNGYHPADLLALHRLVYVIFSLIAVYSYS